MICYIIKIYKIFLKNYYYLFYNNRGWGGGWGGGLGQTPNPNPKL
jgi:hypothetical protein